MPNLKGFFNGRVAKVSLKAHCRNAQRAPESIPPRDKSHGFLDLRSMTRNKLSKRNPFDPEVMKRVREDLRTMPFEELDALMSYHKEGVDETNMFEVLAEYDREQERKKAAEKAA